MANELADINEEEFCKLVGYQKVNDVAAFKHIWSKKAATMSARTTNVKVYQLLNRDDIQDRIRHWRGRFGERWERLLSISLQQCEEILKDKDHPRFAATLAQVAAIRKDYIKEQVETDEGDININVKMID